MSMASKYDEDVYENPFFSHLLANYPSFFSTVVSRKGIICIPKFDVTANHQPTEIDVLDHIIWPTKENDDDCNEYITASKHIVRVESKKVITVGFPVQKEVEILFSETFHSDSGGSYRVLCLDNFLNKASEKTKQSDRKNKNGPPTNYNQCIEMLWSHSGGQRSRETLDRMLASFYYTYDRLEGENLRSIVDAANTHFTKAVQLLLKDSVVRKSAKLNASYMENLKIAVETYVMNTMHSRLFRVITATMASMDSELNKIIRNLTDLQLTDLGIRKVFSQNIPAAKKELSFLNRYSTPLGRLFCMKRVVSTLAKPPKQAVEGESAEMMSTDDLLPIIIFLVIKSEMPNWYANLVYMRHFHFAKLSDDDEYGFYLASVEAALEHIRSGNVRNEILPLSQKQERWNSLFSNEPGDLSPKTSPTVSSPPSVIEEFFRMVQEGDEKGVQAMLEKPHRTSEKVHLKLCHPLCSCDRCDKLQASMRNNSDLVTAYTRDNRGYTALHMAAYYGQGLLIDVLIKNNAVVDVTDYLGLTPLHLACQRGYQNVMLLLLHFEADVMSTDNEGNTPLHLCCANGHEDCVKALVFYDGTKKKLNLNAANEIGDTPLHLAAKWGFEGIIRTLLENNADPVVENRKRQTPALLAQNVKVQRLLLSAVSRPVVTPFRPLVELRSVKSEDNVSSLSSSGSILVLPPNYNSGLHRSMIAQRHSSSPRIEVASLEEANDQEKRRRKEKLFKAIIEGDIQLVKFYLGVKLEKLDEDAADTVNDSRGYVNRFELTLEDMCHPLCQCPKCVDIQKAGCTQEKISINTCTPTGSSLLHTAVLHNHSDIVSLLISLGTDVSCTNHKSFTPLHLACCMRNSLITDMLLKAKPRLNGKDINGDTPLLIAASNGFINGLQMLIKAGADVNALNMMGNTGLHEAVKRGHQAAVEILLSAKCRVTVCNKQDHMPIDMTDDPKLKGLLEKAMESERISLENRPPVSSDEKMKSGVTQGQISIKDLFAAFEEEDLHTVQKLAQSIRTFDRRGSLRRTSTRDASEPFLVPMAQAHSIASFDRNSLKKVNSVDKSQPLYQYYLTHPSFSSPPERVDGLEGKDNVPDSCKSPEKSTWKPDVTDAEGSQRNGVTDDPRGDPDYDLSSNRNADLSQCTGFHAEMSPNHLADLNTHTDPSPATSPNYYYADLNTNANHSPETSPDQHAVLSTHTDLNREATPNHHADFLTHSVQSSETSPNCHKGPSNTQTDPDLHTDPNPLADSTPSANPQQNDEDASNMTSTNSQTNLDVLKSLPDSEPKPNTGVTPQENPQPNTDTNASVIPPVDPKSNSVIPQVNPRPDTDVASHVDPKSNSVTPQMDPKPNTSIIPHVDPKSNSVSPQMDPKPNTSIIPHVDPKSNSVSPQMDPNPNKAIIPHVDPESSSVTPQMNAEPNTAIIPHDDSKSVVLRVTPQMDPKPNSGIIPHDDSKSNPNTEVIAQADLQPNTDIILHDDPESSRDIPHADAHPNTKVIPHMDHKPNAEGIPHEDQ